MGCTGESLIDFFPCSSLAGGVHYSSPLNEKTMLGSIIVIAINVPIISRPYQSFTDNSRRSIRVTTICFQAKGSPLETGKSIVFGVIVGLLTGAAGAEWIPDLPWICES